MKSQLKSQRNILMAYMSVALIVIALIAYGFYLNASRMFINTAQTNLNNMAAQMAQQLDFQIDNMDFALRSLLSDRQFMDATIRRGSPDPDLEFERTISNAILNDAFNRYFFRINYFNYHYDFFTSRFYTRNTASRGSREIFEAMPWLAYVDEARPRPFITQVHNDPWTIGEEIPVFSVMRSIRVFGIDSGYLEAQMTVQELSDILHISENTGIQVAALNPANEVLYSNLADTEHVMESILLNSSEDIMHTDNEIIILYDRPSGIRIVLAQNREVMLAPFGTIGRLIFISGFGILAVAFLHAYVWSKRLVRARELKMQANFDTLQAQISPHFIHNVLNVISSRSFSLGDETIGEICQDMSQMLRYSTSNVNQSADLAQEIAHAGHYLDLQKKRYEHRFNYTIDVDESLLALQVPKLILQPFLENAIDHGYENGKSDINISISVYLSEQSWVIEMRDDGSGFDDDTLAKLEESMRQADKDYLKMSIGKMGMVNTYSRLRMFFTEFQMTFGNNETSGAFVKLKGRISDV